MDDIIYAKVPSVKGLEVSKCAKFRLNGKPRKATSAKKPYGNHRCTVQFRINIDNKCHYWQAAKLVAQAWISGYDIDNDYIVYRDGNCENIHVDNLVIVSKERYWQYMQRNSGHHADDVDKRKKKLKLVAQEAMLTHGYFETQDMTDINKHVEEYLYNCLLGYCVDTLHLGMGTSKSVVPDCIARMYECIMNGMCLYNYERYCKKLLLNYKKKGDFGLTGKVPNPIQLNVQSLNLESLWERFRQTKLS